MLEESAREEMCVSANRVIEKSKEETPLIISTDTLMCAINTETGPQLIVTSNEVDDISVMDLYAFSVLVEKFRKRLLKNNPDLRTFLRSKYGRRFKKYLKGEMGVKTMSPALKDVFEE